VVGKHDPVYVFTLVGERSGVVPGSADGIVPGSDGTLPVEQSGVPPVAPDGRSGFGERPGTDDVPAYPSSVPGSGVPSKLRVERDSPGPRPGAVPGLLEVSRKAKASGNGAFLGEASPSRERARAEDVQRIDELLRSTERIFEIADRTRRKRETLAELETLPEQERNLLADLVVRVDAVFVREDES
jgi:hypothetical protein